VRWARSTKVGRVVEVPAAIEDFAARFEMDQFRHGQDAAVMEIRARVKAAWIGELMNPMAPFCLRSSPVGFNGWSSGK